MKRASALLTAVAVGVLAAPTAQAATHGKHHHRAKGEVAESESADSVILRQEVAQLQAQVNALQARLDQQGAAQTTVASAAQAQAASAAQTAQVAVAKADKAQATAEAAQAEAAKDTKGLDVVKWASNTQVHGTMFFDESTIHSRSNGAESSANGTGFNIKRMYLSVDHQFNNTFSADVTMDASNVIGETANANYVTPATTIPACAATPCASSSANLGTAAIVGKGFYIKKAYVQMKLDPALWIRVGSADLPWVPYVEGIYGHRFVENELLDEYKYGTSADWGVHVGGDLANGLVSYQLSLVDGAGYRNVKVTKAVDVEGRVSMQYKGFFSAVGGYTGKLGNDTQTTSATPTTLHTARRIDFATGYKSDLFTLGGEYFYARDYNSVTTATEDSTRGYSLFGNVNFTPKWSAFGRYDWVKPIANLGTAKAAPVYAHYFNVGLQWEPVKIVDLALVYKREAVDNGSIATQNGTIGGITGTNGTYDEIGVFGQIKF